MAERERLLAGSAGGTFQARTRVMSADDVARAIKRMAHEILERNHGAAGVMIIGMQTGGVELAGRLAAAVTEIEGSEIPVGTLDATMHRDDFGLRPVMPVSPQCLSRSLPVSDNVRDAEACEPPWLRFDEFARG